MPRQPGPWYRKSRQQWFGTLKSGKQIPLSITDPQDREGAIRAFAEVYGDPLAELPLRMLRRLHAKLGTADLGKQTAHHTDPDAPAVQQGTLRELFKEYVLVLARRVQPETATSYTHFLGWMLDHYGKYTVAQMKTAEVEDAVNAEKKWRNNTKRQCLCVIRGFIRWCGRPAFRLKYPAGESRGAEIIISPEEFDKLLSDARGDFHPLLRFWKLTGCRPGEGRALTVEVVDWVHGTITLKQHKTKKKGKQRIIVLCPESLAILTTQREKYGAGPLFRDLSGKMFQPQAVKMRMRRLRKRVGVRDEVIAYSMRHTFATSALEAGVPDADVATLIGHSSTAMIWKHYQHLTGNTKRLKEVITKVNAQPKS